MTTHSRYPLPAALGSIAFAVLGERIAAGIPAGSDGAWSAVATRRTRLAAR
jgi:hypothetical protein